MENLMASDAMVLVLPSGRDAHLELGLMLGRGRPGFILLDEDPKWSVMYQAATAVCRNEQELIEELGKHVA
jgi:hypothetical protein